MSDFERIIRPFQTGDVTPPRRILKEGETPAANVVFELSTGDSAKTFQGSRSEQLNFYMTKKWKEPTRFGSLG